MIDTLRELKRDRTWICLVAKHEVEHRAKREIRDAIVALGVSGKIIQPGRFTQVGDRMLYVESRDRRDRKRLRP